MNVIWTANPLLEYMTNRSTVLKLSSTIYLKKHDTLGFRYRVKDDSGEILAKTEPEDAVVHTIQEAFEIVAKIYSKRLDSMTGNGSITSGQNSI